MRLRPRPAGTQLVWQFNAAGRCVDVFTGPEQFTTLKEDQTLGGGVVLPGLSISLTELFARLDEARQALRLD